MGKIAVLDLLTVDGSKLKLAKETLGAVTGELTTLMEHMRNRVKFRLAVDAREEMRAYDSQTFVRAD